MSLQDRIAILTGATGNLGRIAAQHLAENGARLALAGTNQDRLAELARTLGLPADRYLLHAANLRAASGAQSLAQAVHDKFGRADILLHLVGGWTGGKTVVEAAAPEVDDMLQQHVWTTWHLAQAFVPLLRANGWGRLIVISSPQATHPSAKSGPYALAKAAQEALVLTLAQELRGTGVTANVLQVRAIDTQPNPEPAATTPETITAAILYLCSEQAQSLSGARLPLYGAA